MQPFIGCFEDSVPPATQAVLEGFPIAHLYGLATTVECSTRSASRTILHPGRRLAVPESRWSASAIDKQAQRPLWKLAFQGLAGSCKEEASQHANEPLWQLHVRGSEYKETEYGPESVLAPLLYPQSLLPR